MRMNSNEEALDELNMAVQMWRSVDCYHHRAVCGIYRQGQYEKVIEDETIAMDGLECTEGSCCNKSSSPLTLPNSRFL